MCDFFFKIQRIYSVLYTLRYSDHTDICQRVDKKVYMCAKGLFLPGLVAFTYVPECTFLARHQIRTNKYILLQFPKETNTRGSKTLTPFTPFYTNLQSFD